MAFPFQDVQNFRGGLNLLFIAPLLAFSTTLTAFANISATFIRILLVAISSTRNACAKRRDFGTCGALLEARPFG